MAHENKSPVQHEVMWCRDSCRSSKLAAMVYLVTRKTSLHTIVFMPGQEWNEAAVQALTSAGLSVGKLDGLSNEAMLQRYHNGLIKVLLVTDSLLEKNQINQVKMVVMLATSDSPSQYRERLDKARGGSRRPFTCVSVLPREEGSSLRPVMQALKQPFTQRTVLGDVLTTIEQQVRKQEDVVNTSSGVSSEEEEEDCNDDGDGDNQEEEEEPAALKVLAVTEEKPRGKKRYLIASLKPDSNTQSNRTKPSDEFFSGIESKVSAMDAVLVVTSSNKSRQKKLRRRRKKQQQRTESRLNDTDSNDDDDDSDDEEEEDERPRRVAQGASSRPVGPVAKKRMSSTTEALTDVGVKGVKKYRNALTYQEKSLYNKTYGNTKK